LDKAGKIPTSQQAAGSPATLLTLPKFTLRSVQKNRKKKKVKKSFERD
jgi:hypothetical protein